MDVRRPKTEVAAYKNKKVQLSAVVVVLIGVLFFVSQVDLGLHYVAANTIMTAKVQRGDLAIKVSAPGILVPREVRWVSSNIEGKVERIIVKPGAEVVKGESIVEMLNPELVEQVEDLKWEVEAIEAEHLSLAERHNTQLLDLEAVKLDNQMTYDKEKIRLDAETKLIELKNATVSMLDYESRRLTVAQLKETITMDKARSQQLVRTLNAESDAQSSRLNSLKNRLERARFQVASLNVKAPVSGVLQAMPLEVGQRVAIGENIAKFARKGDLIAQLQVPEYNAAQIVIGIKVSIDTRFNKIEGKVIRIDPAVVDGSVLIEVQLLDGLPEEARPDLSVNGEIYIEEKKDTLFVRRPTFSQAKQQMTVFKFDSTRSVAEKTIVGFGLSSSLDIEILAGLLEGDIIIVSDTSEFQAHNRITTN